MIKRLREIRQEIKVEDPHHYYQTKALIYGSTIVTLMTHVSFNSLALTLTIASCLFFAVVTSILNV